MSAAAADDVGKRYESITGRTLYWRLIDKITVPCSMMECTQIGTRVMQTRIGPNWVSTVFLGIDHNWGEGPPLLFETMIFRGGNGQEMWRSSSWVEAEGHHAEAVALVRKEIKDAAK